MPTTYRNSLAYRTSQAYRGGSSTQTASPAGYETLSFGASTVTHRIVAYPIGLLSQTFGTTDIYLKTRYLFKSGQDFSVFGRMDGALDGFIAFARRTLYLSGIANQTTFGTTGIAFANRTLYLAGNAINSLTFGAQNVWFRVRTMYPQWSVFSIYGSAKVDRTHYLTGNGWDSSSISVNAQVGLPRQSAYPRGWLSLTFGAVQPELHTQYIKPPATLPNLPGDSNPSKPWKVYNLTQYTTELPVWDYYDLGWVSSLLSVVNKNRYQGPTGWDSNKNKWGLPFVYNNALREQFQGFETDQYGRSMIAPRIRTFTMSGIDSLFIRNDYTVVYKTPELDAKGFTQLAFGTASAVNTRRYFGFNGWLSDGYGTPFVAFRVRTLYPTFDYVPMNGTQRIAYNPNPISPAGQYLTQFGGAVLQVIHHYVFPSQLPTQTLYGYPRIYNVTPELYPSGVYTIYDLFGVAKVRTQWRVFQFQGFSDQNIGQWLIAYRTKYPVVTGISSLKIVNTHRIQNVNPNPPGPQNEPMTGFSTSLFGSLKLSTNVVHESGWDNSQYGQAKVILMGCIVKPGITPPYDDTTGSQLGIPHLNYPQAAGPSSIPPATALDQWNQPSDEVFGTPSFAPYYIWAPQGYPYLNYHPNAGELGHPIDAYASGFDYDNPNKWPTAFGDHIVTLKNRTMFGQGYVASSFGGHRISTNPQYAYPSGLLSFTRGIPTMPNFGNTQFYGYDMSSFGNTTVYIYVPPLNPWPVSNAGQSFLAFGTAYIDFKNRTRDMVGMSTFTISPPGAFPPASYINKNYTVVTHAYLPFVFSGWDNSVFGNPFIAFRIRYINAGGDDYSVVCNDDQSDVEDAMKVTQRNYTYQFGFSMMAFGKPSVGLLQRGVSPAGIWQSYIGTCAARPLQTVSPSGFDDSDFGDVWRVIPGEIQVRGKPHTQWGSPKLNQTIYGEGWLDNAIVVNSGIRTYYYDAIGQMAYRPPHLFIEHLVPTMQVSPNIGPSGVRTDLFGAAGVVTSGGICG